VPRTTVDIDHRLIPPYAGAMTQAPLTLRRWTRVEYERLADLGAFDREQKGCLYARALAQDYWIVNLVDHVLEVYREPAVDPAAPYGWRYTFRRTLAPRDTIVPLALPAVRLGVAELLA
jgi:hypothetical protein